MMTDLKSFLGEPNDVGDYVYPDGSAILRDPTSTLWLGRWADGKPMEGYDGESDSPVIERFTFPEGALKCLEENNEGPFAPKESVSAQSESSNVLTKREQIAAMALQGLMSSDPQCQWQVDGLVKISVQCADALLEELAK